VFGAVLDRKLAGDHDDPLEYLEERILDPMDLEVDAWERDAAGHADVAFGAHLTAAEWAKLGILIKDRGRYRGRQIVPAESIDLVLEGSKPAPQYGLGWWRNQAKTGPAPFYAGGLPDLAFAAGVGNQRLYVLPEQDLVVVRFGAVDRHWSDEEFLTRLLGDAAGAGD